MPADARAIALHVTGWTGSVTLSDGVDSAVATPTDPDSAFGIWEDLIAAAAAHWTMTWHVTNDGYLSWTSDTLLTMTFAGGLHTLLGFATSSFSNAYTRTGTGAPRAVIGAGPLYFSADDRMPAGKGETGYGRVSWAGRCPGTEARSPVVRLVATKGQTVRLFDVLEAWPYPGLMDVYVDPETIATVRPEDFRTRDAGRAGHHEVEIPCLR